MIDLAPCPACRRHVRIDETACPFCTAALPAVEPRVLSRGRFTRAAVFAGAIAGTAACGGKTKPADSNNVENVSIDAGPGDTPVPDAEPYVEPPDDYDRPDHDIPMPYGAPPLRDRLV